MPEYLAPGVFVEETSFRPKTIEGVSTSTAAFVGPARYGPTQGEPELLTSFADFERIYGGLEELSFDGTARTNFLAHAVRAFFQEGGKRCYVSRVYNGSDGESSNAASLPSGLEIAARFPGEAGDMRITFIPRLSENLLISNPIRGGNLLLSVKERDTVVVTRAGSPPTTGYFDVVRDGEDLGLRDAGGTPTAISALTAGDDEVQLLTVDVTIERPIVRRKRPGERYGTPEFISGFSLNPNDARSLAAYFNESPSSKLLRTTVPFSIVYTVSPAEDATGADFADALFGDAPPDGNVVVVLSGGDDGSLPGPDEYAGEEDTSTQEKSGLLSLEDLEDVSIVACPGYSAGYESGGDQSQIEQIQAHLIRHCEKMRYRIAVLDSADGQAVSAVRQYRGRVDSKYAALYYPWVTIFDPITEAELNLPPSGFVAGIYARNDVERGVHKAPANEVVRSAIGFEFLINTGQQEALNPEGINCFRFFEGRGNRLWGARTVTSDGEWKYVNLRRYFAYLERSIDKGTQVFVFENNGDKLWDNVRRTIEDFLFNEWKSGRLMGLTPDEAYFVKCDRSTMTQNDIDNGRLICLIGVAPLRPAEFVIFRIGQKLIEMAA